MLKMPFRENVRLDSHWHTARPSQTPSLADKVLARSIIIGTYEIPSDMDLSTKLILKEIGRIGVKLIYEEEMEIIILPKNFKHFWTKVGEFMSSSMSGFHYGHYKASINCDTGTKQKDSATHGCHKKWYPARKLEHRATCNDGEDFRSMPIGKIKGNSAVQSRLQLLQPIHLQKGSIEYLEQNKLHP
jgi:hypothetical protein